MVSQQSSPKSLFRGLALLLFVICGGLSKASMAQDVTLTGVVTDPSNAAIVNAQVSLANNTSHAVRHANTNQTGAYTFPSVPSGSYTFLETASLANSN